VKDKQRQDDAQIASLSHRVSAAPVKTGRDGGMHPMFLAKLKPQEVREPDGTVRYMIDENAKKKLGSYVNPPFETYPTEPETTATAANAPARGTAPKQKARSSVYMTAAAESKPARPRRLRASPSRRMFPGLSPRRALVRRREDTKPVSPPPPAAGADAHARQPAAAVRRNHGCRASEAASRRAQQGGAAGARLRHPRGNRRPAVRA
jgi:hypothetical protein